jgi:hypothetical protein
MASVKETFDQFGQALIDDLKKIIPRVTGKTQDSLRMETTEESLTIYGEQSLGALEDGRGPTRATGGSGAVLAGIKEWIRIKGLDLSPLAVAFNIHKYGNTLYRTMHGGPVNYNAQPIGLKQVLTKQRVDSLSGQLGGDLKPLINSEILKSIDIA